MGVSKITRLDFEEAGAKSRTVFLWRVGMICCLLWVCLESERYTNLAAILNYLDRSNYAERRTEVGCAYSGNGKLVVFVVKVATNLSVSCQETRLRSRVDPYLRLCLF